MAAFLISPVTARADTGNPKIEIVSAAVANEAGIEGKSSVSIDGNNLNVSLGTMTMPGAYAVIEVELVNSGNKTATLALAQYNDCRLDFIKIDFPDIEYGEELTPNEHCKFNMVISWDKDDKENADVQFARFNIHLVYNANEISAKKNTSKISPKTGNDSYLLPIAIGSIILGILILLLIKRGNEKNERAIQKQNNAQ